ncbi:MAG: FadR/GntR family transcriptional regulator [Paraglaciecola sp.]|uniref:FadR/GntR family transcriptional regulator n=1 Tax=Paraglaciecola sp. TaxID=1920173 RepID=UPI0032664D04
MQQSSTLNPLTKAHTSSKRLYLQIAQQLAHMINDNHLVENERLPAERDLASKYDVSRQTVREALIALEVSGLVEIRPGSGVYVVKLTSVKSSLINEDAPGPLEILEARKLVEGDAAALAAMRISNDELLKLEIYLRQMETLVTDKKIAEAEIIDRKFHNLIAEASRNSAMVTMIDWLWEQRNSSEISRVFAQKVRQLNSVPNIDAHNAIYQQLSRRDAQGSQRAMQSHLSEVADAFVLLMGES